MSEVPANADAPALSAWATTGVDALPDTEGRTDLRLRQDVALRSEGALEVDLLGGWRILGTGDPAATLYRLSAAHEFGPVRLAGGRVVRLGATGFEPVDGLTARFGEDGAVTGQAWAGRLWDAESWHGPSGYVGGVELTVRPRTEDGGVSHRRALTLATESRVVDGLLSQRVAALGALRFPDGRSGTADVEVAAPLADGAEQGVRGGLFARRPLARGSAHLELRHEGLAPASEARREPTDWLADDDYEIAQATFAHAFGPLQVTLAAAGTARDPFGDTAYGGQARARVSLAGDAGSVGVFAASAGLGKARLHGAGALFAVPTETVTLTGDGAWWRVWPLDGRATDTWETRVNARFAPLPAGPADLQVAVTSAAGSDRNLGPWLRAGATVTVRTSSAR